MKTRILIIIIAAVIVGAAAALAQSYGPHASHKAASAPARAVAIAGSIKGTYGYQAGKCQVGFSDQCYSTDCMCYTVNGTASLGGAGKGAASFYATLDFGSGDTSGPDGDCFPVWGEMVVNAAKDTQNWHAVGYACDGVDGRGTPMMGGLVLGNSAIYSEGIAQFTIQFNFSRYTCSMTIRGKAGM